MTAQPRTDSPVVLTPGEPAGIGPDVCLQMLAAGNRDRVIVLADACLLRDRAREIGLDVEIEASDSYPQAVARLNKGCISVLQHDLYSASRTGRLDHGNSRYVLDCLDTAEILCRTGEARALVTGPVHKGIINDAGIAFSGHTEYLAAPSGSEPVMMLTTEQMRVVLATTHLPLRDVANAIERDMLVRKLTTTHDYLHERFGLDEPAILVLGLNPHAGEDGHLGTEEIDIIIPALEQLRMQGMNLVGPLPADTAFTPQNLEHADAVLAMYHDQGLPVLKHSGFGRAVNVTMGLPFVRTSVDHGTALSLAGTGRAGNASLINATELAFQLT